MASMPTSESSFHPRMRGEDNPIDTAVDRLFVSPPYAGRRRL